MSTAEITTRAYRKIKVSDRLLTVTDTLRERDIVTVLDEDQRRTLAAALDPDRGVETGYALQVDALTRERDALDSQLTRVDMECAKALYELEWSRKDRDRLDERVREANARADAAEAKVRELEKAVDPVEALAEELYAVARNGDDPPWHLATENNREKHRRIARHQIERKDVDR